MSIVLDWLLEDNNPAVQYRTKVELLNEKADKQRVIDWINKFLPVDWENTNGLWFQYYLTAIAECGLTYQDIKINKDKALNFIMDKSFEFGCGDFMQLRASIMLGLQNESQILELIHILNQKQLNDGGFLCLHRLDKFKYAPKSCVKSNQLALLFCSECKKRGITLEMTDALLSYFWNHRLFYRTADLSTLILNSREGWRAIDTFYPFEVMRVGIQNIIEAFCSLGYGNDERLKEAWSILNNKRTHENKILLNGTLSKSYLPKERVGQPGKWVTFYTLLAEKEAVNNVQLG